MKIPDGYKRLEVYKAEIYRPYNGLDVNLGENFRCKLSARVAILIFLITHPDWVFYRDGRIDEKCIDLDGKEIWWLVDVVKRW